MPRVVEYFGSLKAALSRRINMVTFANLGSVRLPSLKFVGLRVRKIQRIYLQHFPSYSNHNCKKNHHFYVPGLHFLFALGTPLWLSRKTLHE